MTKRNTITEAQFQKNVVELAHMLGWRVAHFGHAQTSKGYRTPVRYDGKGFPDLVLVHPERGIIFAELKSDTGKLSPEQNAWLDDLQESALSLGPEYDTPVQVHLWFPRDMVAGLIPRVLGAPR